MPRFCLNSIPPVGRGKLVIACPAGSFLRPSPRVQEGRDREMMILIALEAVSAGNKPPAAVSARALVT